MNWPDDFINKAICGDCLEVMKEMPKESVDMVITSPPYWGLRDYGFEHIFGGEKNCEHEWGDKIKMKKMGRPTKWQTSPEEIWDTSDKGTACSKCQAWKGQLGLEPTPELYIKHLTEIFNEIKRVLKKEGTLWLNIGDTYWSAKGSCFNPGGGEDSIETKRREIYPLNRGKKSDVPNLPQKCLTMIPERLAWSLIQNGWILRNKIIWYKPNAMPSSVTDRFSNRWEYLFMFSKNQKYYFDLDAIREPHAQSSLNRALYPADRSCGEHELGKNPGDVIKAGSETRTMGAIIGSGGGVKVPGGKGWTGHPKGGGAACQKDPRWCPPEGKNPGDFFEIATQPFPEAHFAVFPEKLCEKPIKAGCPEEVCKKCGKARERIVERIGGPQGDHRDDLRETDIVAKERMKTGHSPPAGSLISRRYQEFGYPEYKTTGWTSCDCNAGFEGGIVLDPFCGAGTALYVAKEMRRRFIGIDIKQEYCDMAEKRTAQGVL